jgi:hypothetical protein
MSKRHSIGVIIPPWATATGRAEAVDIYLDCEDAAIQLSVAANMTVEDAQAYIDQLAMQRAEWLALEEHGAIGHA